jgi:hypothetical protein
MILKIFLVLVVLGFLVLSVARLVTGLYARQKIIPLSEVASQKVAIVFGAGLWRNGTATPVLHDRVQTAADLYLAGKVERLLMSGDNRFVDYNEPAVMRDLALSLGVPEEVWQAHLRHLLPGQSHLRRDNCHPGDASFPPAARHLPLQSTRDRFHRRSSRPASLPKNFSFVLEFSRIVCHLRRPMECEYQPPRPRARRSGANFSINR